MNITCIPSSGHGPTHPVIVRTHSGLAPVRFQVQSGQRLSIELDGQALGQSLHAVDAGHRAVRLVRHGHALWLVGEDPSQPLLQLLDFYDTPDVVLLGLQWAYDEATHLVQGDQGLQLEGCDTTAAAAQAPDDTNDSHGWALAVWGLGAAGLLSAASHSTAEVPAHVALAPPAPALSLYQMQLSHWPGVAGGSTAPVFGPMFVVSAAADSTITHEPSATVIGLTSGAVWQYRVDDGMWVDGSASAHLQLQPGTHSYVVRQTDSAGKTSEDSAAFVYTLDTTAPTLVSTTQKELESALSPATDLSLTFSENIQAGSGNIVLHDVTAGTDTVFSASDTRQVSIEGQVLTLNPLSDLRGGHRYEVYLDTGAVLDMAGNPVADAGQGPVWGFETQSLLGQPVISLGPDLGQLILPVQVEGQWYYAWDRNGNGVIDPPTSPGSPDFITMEELRTLLQGGGAGTVTEGDAHAVINGVEVVLPTLGMSTANPKPQYQMGTPVSTETVGWDTDPNSNPVYDGWLAIWDAFNGDQKVTAISGVPPGWEENLGYWTASMNAQQHFGIDPRVGYPIVYPDNAVAYVAFEVL